VLIPVMGSYFCDKLMTLILAPIAPIALIAPIAPTPLMVLFHSIGRLVRLEPDAREGRPTPQKWSEKASSDRPRALSRMSDHLSPSFGSKVRRQIRCKFRPVRGGPDIRWSEKAPLGLRVPIIRTVECSSGTIRE